MCLYVYMKEFIHPEKDIPRLETGPILVLPQSHAESRQKKMSKQEVFSFYSATLRHLDKYGKAKWW